MDQGGGDLEDVVAAGDFLVASGFVDPKRIIVYGASNGAYLTLLALGKYPGRFAAGVALYPFVDFATLYASEPPWIRSIDDVLMGDQQRNASLWRERSAITYADRIRAPVMMTAGANDPRCPPAQAREMERRIKARGVHVELTIYGEQGHGTVDTESYVDENTRVVNFMNKHVRDRPRSAVPVR